MNKKPYSFSTKDTLTIRVPCDAICTEEIDLTRTKWLDDVDYYYYMSFRTCTFYGAQSVIEIIKARIRFAWQAIRKGNYIHQEIILNKESLKDMRDMIDKMLEE